jgi:transglutaminase-like putative cysteine protease
VAIGSFSRLCRNGTMATASRFRRLLLCTTSILLGAQSVAIAAENRAAQSWFDQQLTAKTAALLSHSQKVTERDSILAVALIEQIYELRDHVTDPGEIDALLMRVADDVTSTAAVRAEAGNLKQLLSDARNQINEDRAAKALLGWFVGQSDDASVDLANAVVSIRLFHNWNDAVEAESTAELANNPEAWYRASRTASDEYHRTQDLRRALQLDENYVPAVMVMARQYWAQGQPSRARSLIVNALEHHPGEPSLRVLEAELDINQGHGSDALVIMNELRDGSVPIAVSRDLSNDYAQLGFLNEARELAHGVLKLHPNGAQERELVLRLDAQAGDTAALAADGELVGKAQQNGATAGNDTDDQSDTNDPDSERLRRLLRGEPLQNANDSRYLVNVSELVQKWRSLPVSKRSESRILADVRIDQLRSDYQSVQHIQQVIAIGSAADLAAYRTRSIQYSPQSQELNVIRARVYHSDGRMVEAENQGESSVVDESVSMYYDLRAREYRFRDLRVGDVVEVRYTIAPIGGKNPYGAYFADLIAFGGALPCDLRRYVLRAPTNIHLSSAEHLLATPETRSVGNESIYIWEKKDLAALVREPHSASWSEQGAYVHVSNFDSWQALGKWYRDLAQPQFKLNAQLESTVSAIVQQHPNRLDRIAAIDELVLKSTRYVALEFGVYGFKPYPITQTFARGFGDCKDKASLIVALLRAAGIDAEIALVRTQHLGDILPQPASASIFDHAIVYVPEFDLWLDGTAEFSRLRELPVEDQGVMALTIDADGAAVLRRTPMSSAADNYSRRTIDARIESDGTIHFSGATYVRGEDAPELRRQLEPSDAKLGYVRERLAQVLPAVEVHDVELPQSASGDVSLNFVGDLTSFRGQRTATLPSSWMERNYVTTLAASSSRQQDLLLQAPWTTEEEIHIQLPEGAHLAALPKNQTISDQFGTATLEYHLDGQEITVLSKIQFSSTRIPASQYPRFRAFTTNLEDAFRRDIQVQLP